MNLAPGVSGPPDKHTIWARLTWTYNGSNVRSHWFWKLWCPAQRSTYHHHPAAGPIHAWLMRNGCPACRSRG